MKKGDKVKWKDLVNGRTRYGILVDWYKTVLESQEIDDLHEDLKWKKVDKEGWDIKEDKTGNIFALDIGQFEVIKPN